jgi:hypothetical protein
MTVTAEEVDKEIERFAERPANAGRAAGAVGKEGGVGRLYGRLRREKAVDLAMSRATIAEARREADGA